MGAWGMWWIAPPLTPPTGGGGVPDTGGLAVGSLKVSETQAGASGVEKLIKRAASVSPTLVLYLPMSGSHHPFALFQPSQAKQGRS